MDLDRPRRMRLSALKRQLQSIIIHFGLYKLQLIKDAKRICPDVVIVLGEDLTRFRNVSKELYGFLRSFSWNHQCERLGFDEVWMEITDIIDYNIGLLNKNDLANSFFCLSKDDPTAGFAFDASKVAGHTYPESSDHPLDSLRLRLHLGSHFAQHLRKKLETDKGFTCTVGISTNKLLSKLVGNLHKPKDQTTLVPPYTSDDGTDNVTSFIDGHEVGKIPGIGFKLAQKLRAHMLQRPADFDDGLVHGETKENVLVEQIRQASDLGAETLEKILGGPGTPHGIGARVWGLLNGCDDSEVGQARDVPRQISIEDSYVRLDTLDEATKELLALSKSLVKRMHADLLEDDDEDLQTSEYVGMGNAAPLDVTSKRWLAFPKTIRLSTRPRPPQNPDGSRNRSFARISRSASMPNFVFNLKETIDSLATRLVKEVLLPLFKRLHPQKSGWNLSLVNIAATNMVDAANEKGGGVGRDIGKMFKRQDDVLKQWTVYDASESNPEPEQGPDTKMMAVDQIEQEMEPMRTPAPELVEDRKGSEDVPTASQQASLALEDHWEYEDEDMLDEDSYNCEECGAIMPLFAMGAHARWHANT
ncbi:DNA/RNA polymerase [Byssothecium circinans]|uniref:DNA/RNA polymerase n=1 Tax=Byssothecium circinans TaxID=147558 RepID=A0A6A5UGM6_9PLEO|nr:DNA/RNA polymerase [Byssothecium circinans]